MVRLMKRMRQQRPSLAELTADQLRELETGQSYFGAFASLEQMREAWERHGEALLERWAQECPGERPFAWWLFVGVPTWGERKVTRWWDAECEANRSEWLTKGILATHCQPPWQEHEWEYLQRYNLLSESETKAIGNAPRAEDWKGW